MKRKSQKFLAGIVAATLLTMPLVGCGGNNTNDNTKNNTTNNTTNNSKNNANNSATNNTPGEAQKGDELERSKSLADKLAKVDGIKEVSVVVHDNTAVVGIKYNDGADKAKVKSDIDKMVKDTDSKVTTVKISDDETITGKIKKMYDDLVSGETWGNLKEGYDNFLNDIKM